MDTSTVYDKAQSDARFLGVNGTAANAVNATNAALDHTTAGQIWYQRPDVSVFGLLADTGWGSVTSSHGPIVWSTLTLTRAAGAGVAQIQVRGAVSGGNCVYAISAEVVH